MKFVIPIKYERKRQQIARIYKRTGMNPTPLFMTKKKWIAFNVMYANFFK